MVYLVGTTIDSKLGFKGMSRATIGDDLLVAPGWWWRFTRHGRAQRGGWVMAAWTPRATRDGVGHGARLGRVRRRMGHGGEAEQAGGWCITTVVGGCAVDTVLQADDAVKVVGVVCGKNIREWKNGHCLFDPIDT
jgi:hypothetical protein